ncbi:MAG: hypothetical protein ACKPJD_31705, partial [Planctomycetaceae bacterium]
SSGTRRSRGQQTIETPRGKRPGRPPRAGQGSSRAAQGPARSGPGPRGARSQQAAASKNRNRRRP